MSVRLFTLGILFKKDSYGYEIREIARLWGLPRWADIQEGSIYHALHKLKAEGLIEECETDSKPDTNRPRYPYRITPTGKSNFLTLLRDTCRSAPVEKRDIDIALAFLDFLPSEERVSLLQERQDSLQKTRAELLERQRNTHRVVPNVHPWVDAGVEHSLGRIDFEIEWNRSLLAKVATWSHAIVEDR